MLMTRLASFNTAKFPLLNNFPDLLFIPGLSQTDTQKHRRISTDQKKSLYLFFIGLHTDMCELSWIAKVFKALSCFTVVDLGKEPDIWHKKE